MIKILRFKISNNIHILFSPFYYFFQYDSYKFYYYSVYVKCYFKMSKFGVTFFFVFSMAKAFFFFFLFFICLQSTRMFLAINQNYFMSTKNIIYTNNILMSSLYTRCGIVNCGQWLPIACTKLIIVFKCKTINIIGQ